MRPVLCPMRQRVALLKQQGQYFYVVLWIIEALLQEVWKLHTTSGLQGTDTVIISLVLYNVRTALPFLHVDWWCVCENVLTALAVGRTMAKWRRSSWIVVGLEEGLREWVGISFEGSWCFFKGSFDFLMEGAGGNGVHLEKAAQQILLCSSAQDRLFLERN